MLISLAAFSARRRKLGEVGEETSNILKRKKKLKVKKQKGRNKAGEKGDEM